MSKKGVFDLDFWRCLGNVISLYDAELKQLRKTNCAENTLKKIVLTKISIVSQIAERKSLNNFLRFICRLLKTNRRQRDAALERPLT